MTDPQTEPHDRIQPDEYMRAVAQAPFAVAARYLSPVCPDCDAVPTDDRHRTLHGMVVIGCEGYLVVDPCQIGLSAPNWLGIPRRGHTNDRYTLTASLSLDGEELAALLCEAFAARGGDAPEPFPTLDHASMAQTVREAAQGCAQGWHTRYYDADNEDEATDWARAEVRRLIPGIHWSEGPQ